VLGQLIAAARAGESRPLVVRGDPGVGKTALLDYLAEHASGSRVAHAAWLNLWARRFGESAVHALAEELRRLPWRVRRD
jgi:chromosomal replication initiation ATPase DnaA